MPSTVRKMLDGTTVIPVLAFTEVTPTLRVIENMVSSGLNVIELTLRSDVAMETLAAAKTEFGETALLGMGTILTADQLRAVEDAGADFGVSPGLSPELLSALAQSSLPFLPGTSTVSEAMAAKAAGYDMLKFFPAVQAGGPAYLKAMGAVLGDVKFCPTGGITSANAKDFLALDNVLCVGSSELTKFASTDAFDAKSFAKLVSEYQT